MSADIATSASTTAVRPEPSGVSAARSFAHTRASYLRASPRSRMREFLQRSTTGVVLVTDEANLLRNSHVGAAAASPRDPSPRTIHVAAAATRLRGISTSRPRRRRDPPPRSIQRFPLGPAYAFSAAERADDASRASAHFSAFTKTSLGASEGSVGAAFAACSSSSMSSTSMTSPRASAATNAAFMVASGSSTRSTRTWDSSCESAGGASSGRLARSCFSVSSGVTTASSSSCILVAGVVLVDSSSRLTLARRPPLARSLAFRFGALLDIVASHVARELKYDGACTLHGGAAVTAARLLVYPRSFKALQKLHLRKAVAQLLHLCEDDSRRDLYVGGFLSVTTGSISKHRELKT